MRGLSRIGVLSEKGTLLQLFCLKDKAKLPGGFEIDVRLPQGPQHPLGRTPVLKPSSISNVPIGWIIEPTTDSWLNSQ